MTYISTKPAGTKLHPDVSLQLKLNHQGKSPEYCGGNTFLDNDTKT